MYDYFVRKSNSGNAFSHGDLNNFSINGNSYMVCMLLNGVLGGRNISI